jgi:predicted TIM-barrel fold metal-dependent hydrolase
MKVNPGSLSLIDAHTHVGVDLLFYLKGYAPYGLGWSELCEAGDALQVERFVVFPMPTHLALRADALREGRIESDGAWEKVPYAFENRRMASEIARHPQGATRALPFWMFDPAREPELQCEALRALHKEYPCAGLKVQATIIQSPISSLLGAGACLLDLAEEKNWPVLIHTSVHPSDPWSPVADILRIVEARPRLRFNLAHSCRFDRPSLDRIAELPNAWFDCSAHAIHCDLAVQDRLSVAAKDRRFDSDYRDPVRVLADLAAAYPDKLLWGSDAPFHSYSDETLSLMSSYKREVEILRALGPEVVARIASTNILAYLG